MQNLDTFSVPSNFRGKSKFYVQIWWIVQAILIRPSPQVLYGWRRFWIRLFGAKIGHNVLIRPSVKITYPWKVSIGDYSWIGNNVELYSLGPIQIGHHTVISQQSYLCTGSHDYDKPSFDIISKPVIVGNYCWLAADVYVAPGITIGDGSIIGARSSVFKDIPENLICYGNPARVIKKRNE